MQKVLRRSLLARNQQLKRTRRADKAFHRTRLLRERAFIKNVKAERQNRREDWMLGPLAPKRDVGAKKFEYGLMDPIAHQLPEVPKRDRLKRINFAAGDRVCIIRGLGRGKIGEIKDINVEHQSVFLTGVNEVSYTGILMDL